jgi:hypothetical protein
MDPLHLLLADMELLEQSITTSCLALKSRIKNSHDLINSNSGHRIQWARSLRLEYILAIYLKPGTETDGLFGVKNMTEQDILEACEMFSIKMKDVLLSELVHLRSETRDSNSTKEQSDLIDRDIQGELALNLVCSFLDNYCAINTSTFPFSLLICCKSESKDICRTENSNIGLFIFYPIC